MKQFFRVIKQPRWFKCSNADGLNEGDLQGDAFSDIQTSNCQLPVFRVSNENDKQRVITAYAATRHYVDYLAYAIFEDSDFDSLGITVEQTEGKTPDTVVNEMHYLLGELTATRLVELARIISVGKHDRKLKKQIKFELQKAVRSDQLDPVKFKPTLLKSLQL